MHFSDDEMIVDSGTIKLVARNEFDSKPIETLKRSVKSFTSADEMGIDECSYSMEEEFRAQNGLYGFSKDSRRVNSYKKILKSSCPNYTRQVRNRVVLKNGMINFSQEKVEKRGRRYLLDTLTTMVDLQWRYNLLVFAASFILCWLFFGLLWYIMAYWHGDTWRSSDEDHCIVGVNTFTAAFYFAFESQATLGLGGRYPQDDCIMGVILLCIQAIVGAMIQCFVVGFVFAKLSRPNKRSQTILFSRHGVISRRDGQLCLFFRVGDIRDRSFIVNATISAMFITDKLTREGEVLHNYHMPLKVSFDGCKNEIFLSWPAIIVHKIDKDSPLYWMNAELLARNSFEILLLLRGCVESTGQTVEIRTSYLSNELLWGRRFTQMINYRIDTGQYSVDYSKFDSIYQVHTPNVSAKGMSHSCSSMPATSEFSLVKNDGDDSCKNDDVFK